MTGLEIWQVRNVIATEREERLARLTGETVERLRLLQSAGFTYDLWGNCTYRGAS